jgi:hypothetical protein
MLPGDSHHLGGGILKGFLPRMTGQTVYVGNPVNFHPETLHS